MWARRRGALLPGPRRLERAAEEERLEIWDATVPLDASWEAERSARRAAEASAARLTRLQAATAALSASRTPDEVADAALGAGIAALDGTRGFVLVDGGGELAVLRCAGIPEPAARRAASGGFENPAAEAFRTGAAVFVEGREDMFARYPGLAAYRDDIRAQAIVALPLALGGRTQGVLTVEFEDPRRFGEADRALAHALAGQCAAALDRARLFVSERLARAEAVASRSRLVFLDGLSALLAESPGEAEMLAGVARLAVPALGDWTGFFLTTERDGIVLAAQAGLPAVGAAVEAHLRADSLLRLEGACRCGPPVALHDFAPDASGSPAVGSAVVAPLCLASRALGAVVIAAADPLRRYGAPDLALATQVGHRTALAVEHARLLRDATAAAAAREEFLQVASHELRGPIATLRLAVHLLGRDARDGKGGAVAERLRVIDRQAGRLGRLADTLLDVSRITAKRLDLAREPGDLAALVREIVARCEDEAAEAGVELRVDAPGEVRCAFDPARMDQVLTNLLSNAVKYGRERPVEVRVRRDGAAAVVEVQDHGIGVAAEDQERIFERFERAVSARHFGGIGLGLWIVRRLVEAHGGTIRVTSVAGEGATFAVALPLA